MTDAAHPKPARWRSVRSIRGGSKSGLGVNAPETMTNQAPPAARGKRLFVAPSTELCGADIALIELNQPITTRRPAGLRVEAPPPPPLPLPPPPYVWFVPD